jgi:sec-independent protein translocase protein TatB
MFDFGVGYSELFVLALVAVIVIGPKDLPRVLRTFGQFMNKARRMAGEFQTHVDAAMKDSGVSDIRKDIEQARGAVSQVMNAPNISPPVVSSNYNPADKSFATYFGESPKAGETRVAGELVQQEAPAT